MKHARFWMLWVGLLCFALKPCLAVNDIVTLNSGEEIAGRIIAENNTQFVIEVSNESQTIFSEKSVLKSAIKSVQRETAAAKQERLAYEATQKYRLNPDQELLPTQYDAGVFVCQKYLETYSNSEHVVAIQLQLFQLQQEKVQVEKGMLKFGNRWMSASQKALEQVLRLNIDEVQRLQRDLPSLEKQRDQTRADIADAQSAASKALAEHSAAAINHDQARQTEASQKRATYSERMKQSQDLLRTIESKISRERSDLTVVQRKYDAAKAKYDSLVVNLTPSDRPVSSKNVASNTTANIPVRTGTGAPQMPAASVKTVPAPPLKFPNIALADSYQHQVSDEKQRQEQARIQAEKDRQALAEQQRQAQLQHSENSLPSIVLLCVFVGLGVIGAFFMIARHGLQQQKQSQRQAELTKKQLADERRQRDEKDRQRIALEWQKEREAEERRRHVDNVAPPVAPRPSWLPSSRELERLRRQAENSTPPAPEPSWQPPKWAYPQDQQTAPPAPVVVAKLGGMFWNQFEKVVGLVYELQGYRVTGKGGANPDGGIDRFIERNGVKTAVQCKHWEKSSRKKYQVNEPLVRQLLGAMTHAGASHGMFVTLDAVITAPARQLAVQHNISFVNAAHLAAMIADLSQADQRKVQAMLDDTTAYCPKCNSTMVWRPKVLNPFWGCSRYRYTGCRGQLFKK